MYQMYRARSKEFHEGVHFKFLDLPHTRHKSTPVIGGRDAGRLDVPPEDVVDEARLPRAVVAENKHERHLRRLITTRVQLLQRPVHVVVQRLDQACVELVAPIHDLGLHFAVKGGQRAAWGPGGAWRAGPPSEW